MTSDDAYVWIWLPGSVEPVVAGVLEPVGSHAMFTYGSSYLERGDAIPLYWPELPLQRDPIVPPAHWALPGCIADAGPDAWGRRVIEHRILRPGSGVSSWTAHPLDYLLLSGSDRIGALDFQSSPSLYQPRATTQAPLEELVHAAELLEAGEVLHPALDEALLHGSSIGGARPKALLRGGDRELIAKFASSADTYPVVRYEYVGMELARRVGLNVAAVELSGSMGKDVLLVERFDRVPAQGGMQRRAMVSALTMLDLGDQGWTHASYADLAELVRRQFTAPTDTLREMFARIVFNVLVGNTDDHARNHAAFWDGNMLTLTPAYDLMPFPRTGGEARQAMAFAPDGDRMSQVTRCLRAAGTYLLSEPEAREIVDRQIAAIRDAWSDVCDQAELGEIDRSRLWERAVLNPYALEGYGRSARR